MSGRHCAMHNLSSEHSFHHCQPSVSLHRTVAILLHKMMSCLTSAPVPRSRRPPPKESSWHMTSA